jgi:hypothetical protein
MKGTVFVRQGFQFIEHGRHIACHAELVGFGPLHSRKKGRGGA